MRTLAGHGSRIGIPVVHVTSHPITTSLHGSRQRNGLICTDSLHNRGRPHADSDSYSRAPEILEYFRGVARKYELYRFIKLNHKVIETRWIDEKGIWSVRVEDTITGHIFEDWCHFMITGSGILKCVYSHDTCMLF